MRTLLSFTILLAANVFSRLCYRHELGWVGAVPDRPWRGIRIVCFLNHTSLFEWLFAGIVPTSFLWRIARHGVIPAADVTTSRPVVGWFFKALTPHVVSITREPDHTWERVLYKVDRDSMVVILPEGRMMRATGLDKEGKPMTVRGGIADLLRVIPEGRMLIAYSGGLHHVQVPGQRLPRLFRTLRLNVEVTEIEEYRRQVASRGDAEEFRRLVKRDLESRRDRHCPVRPGTAGPAGDPSRPCRPSR